MVTYEMYVEFKERISLVKLLSTFKKLKWIVDLNDKYFEMVIYKNKKERYEFVRKWPHLSEDDKKKRHLKKLKKEEKSLKKLIQGLPLKERKEIWNIWWDYEMGKTQEARFVRQTDRAEGLIEAFDCWKRDKNFPTKPWWQHAD